mmetsp:Transcript_33951/g.39196  ORF Transcript_33951/g.39196 Transcript_33951/m.39196 type:complete len:87 (+) Transcript_33951:810-1070(+)
MKHKRFSSPSTETRSEDFVNKWTTTANHIRTRGKSVSEIKHKIVPSAIALNLKQTKISRGLQKKKQKQEDILNLRELISKMQKLGI